MANQTFSYRTNGSTAYKPERRANDVVRGRIIIFPGAQTVQRKEATATARTHGYAKNLRPQHEASAKPIGTNEAKRTVTHSSRFAHLLSTSEMYCSLKTESLAGVKLNAFTKAQTAGLFAIGAVLAAIALILGM